MMPLRSHTRLIADTMCLVGAPCGSGLAGAQDSGGDYRFGIVRSKDDAPAFFGQDTRYMHRVYGAVIINTFK